MKLIPLIAVAALLAVIIALSVLIVKENKDIIEEDQNQQEPIKEDIDVLPFIDTPLAEEPVIVPAEEPATKVVKTKATKSKTPRKKKAADA